MGLGLRVQVFAGTESVCLSPRFGMSRFEAQELFFGTKSLACCWGSQGFGENASEPNLTP